MLDTTTEFTIVRTFEATPDEVWRMWVDPDEFPRWLHPRGVSTPRERVEVDARVGGRYQYVMVNDADGSTYPTGGTYLELDEPTRLVFTWGEPDTPVDEAPIVTVSLAARGAGTELTFRLVGAPGKPGDGFIYDGWASALDLLAERSSE